MSGQLAFDLPGVFESRGNPRTPAPPISYTRAAKNWPTVAKPVAMSKVPRNFEPVDVTIGAMYLGFDERPRRAVKRAPAPAGEELPERELLPQMIAIASVLEARKPDGEMLYDEVAVSAPRRCAKTTSIWCVLIGRCVNNPGHKVAFTAQSGVKASEIFLDMANALEAHWNATHTSFDKPPFRVYRGVGHEAVVWANGSVIRAYPPDPSALRSAGADTVYIEEAQEHNAAKSELLLGGVLSLMDTMDAPQIIIAGTPGLITDGMLHDSLEAGKAGKDGVGIVLYAVPVDEHGTPLKDCSNPKTWDQHHPGIGTLTTAAIIAKRHEKLAFQQFLREYCCVWPVASTGKVIEPAWWDACRIPWGERETTRPARFALAFDVALDQSSAAVAVAWRDDKEIAHAEIIAHDEGDDWLVRFLLKLAPNARNVVFGYDSIGNNINIVNEVMRSPRGRPRFQAFAGGKPTAAATAALYTAIKAGKFRHYDQHALNAAAAGAGKRSTSSETTGWYWARRSAADVTPLVAVTIALATLDKQPRGSGSAFGSRRTTDTPNTSRA